MKLDEKLFEYWEEETNEEPLVQFTYLVYELDEDGDALDSVADFDLEGDAIEFAKKQDFPTHVVFVPYPDSDEGPEYAEYIEEYAPNGYHDYEVVWSSLNEAIINKRAMRKQRSMKEDFDEEFTKEQEALKEDYEEYILVDANGDEVKIGERIKDFRGDISEFVKISRNPEGGKSGKIIVRDVSEDEEMEYYPGVFDLKIIKREELKEKTEEVPAQMFTIFAKRTENSSTGEMIHTYAIIIEADSEEEARDIYTSVTKDFGKYEILGIHPTTPDEIRKGIHVINKFNEAIDSKEIIVNGYVIRKADNSNNYFVYDNNGHIEDEEHKGQGYTSLEDAKARAESLPKGIAINESLEVEEVVSQPPQPGEETGIADVINKLIIDEWEAISGYNSALATLKDLGRQDLTDVLTDIVAEENIHVGQLEKVLQEVSPNAVEIDKGKFEAEEQLNEPTDIINTASIEDPEEGMHY